MGTPLPRGTVTFLFSDIEGSTELSRRHGASYGDVRDEHRRLLREAFAAHNGREVDAEGDAFFAVFQRAGDAVNAAVAAQRALADARLVRVRMGLHTTEPHVRTDGYVGVGVSRAARICAAASGGQIVVSQTTAGVIQDHELPGVAIRDLGEHYLKDIPHPQRLFQVDVEGLPTEFPPLGGSTAGSIATLLFVDLVGWTDVMREIGDERAAAAASAYHGIVAEIAAANRGHEVEKTSDLAMCVFSAAKDALGAALALRRELRQRDWITGTNKPELTAAIHTGRIARLAPGQLGTPSLRAIQLCNTALAGQILVSETTQSLLEGEALGGLELRDLGEREVPWIPSTRVYELGADERS